MTLSEFLSTDFDTRAFLEFTQALVVAVDADGHVVFANQEMRSMLGYDREELVGRDWFETCVPESARDGVRQTFERVIAGDLAADVAQESESPVLTNAGEEYTIQWRNTPVRDDDGSVTGMLSSGTDVTQQRAQTRQLAQNRRRSRTLVEQFPNGLVTLFDEDLRYQIVGGNGFDRVRLSPSDLEGERLQDVFPPDVVRELEPHYRNALAGTSSVIEQTLEGRIFRIRTVPVYEDGAVVAGMTMSQDITDQRETERELRERELRLSQAQDIADIGNWTFDLETNSLNWSDECYRIFGLSPENDITYERFLECVHPEDRETVDEQWTQALAGEPYDLEHRIVVDGDVKWVRERAEIQHDEDGEPSIALGIAQDITERKAREQELEATKRRYQTLLETAPNPTFVVDPETAEILETNEAAEALLGRSRDELVGLQQPDVHPTGAAERYRELFERHVEQGGRIRQFPDGSPIRVVDADGETIPVEIDATTVDLGDGPVVYGTLRDVSEQRAYERALAGLNHAAQQLFEAQTTDAIDEQIAETVTEVLDFPVAAVYRFDNAAATLRPVACRGPDGAGGCPDELTEIGPDTESAYWTTFVTDETSVDDDLQAGETPLARVASIRSQLVVPIENYGIVAIGDTDPERFGARTTDLLEILVATAESALARTEREQELHRREHKLAAQTRELERAEAFNTQIRSVARAIVDADTRAEIAEAVSSRLTEIDPIAFAWTGTVGPAEDVVEPRAWAGTNERYLEGFDGSLTDAETAEPSVRAARTHEPVIVPNTAQDVAAAPWRGSALECGFRSVLSVPLLYRGSLQGVFTVYATAADAFDETLCEVLSDLGDLVAHAVVGIDRKQALLSNQMIELTFDIRDRSCFFLRLPQDAGYRLELEGMLSHPDESTLVFARIYDADAETVLDQAERAPEVQDAHLIERDGDLLLQAQFDRRFIGSYLAEYGITLQDITADETCRVTVTTSPSYNVRRAVDVVQSRYPDSELRSKRNRDGKASSQPYFRAVLDRLTPRQQEVLELAYHSGYFDSPKGSTGTELAEALDISSSAFHDHVRTAERKLLDGIFDSGDERQQ